MRTVILWDAEFPRFETLVLLIREFYPHFRNFDQGHHPGEGKSVRRRSPLAPTGDRVIGVGSLLLPLSLNRKQETGRSPKVVPFSDTLQLAVQLNLPWLLRDCSVTVKSIRLSPKSRDGDQPDFSYLAAWETKKFSQYFLSSDT